jgi:hypothetical protein
MQLAAHAEVDDLAGSRRLDNDRRRCLGEAGLAIVRESSFAGLFLCCLDLWILGADHGAHGIPSVWIETLLTVIE